MTATLKPLKALVPVTPAEHPTLAANEHRTSAQIPAAVARELALPRHIANELKSIVPATVSSHDVEEKRSDGRMRQEPADRPGVEMRVSVVDAADRLLYEDLRDKRGWQQPLAAGSAVREARHRSDGDGGLSTLDPRTLMRTTAAKAVPIQNRAGMAPAGTTPYSAGKAGIASRLPVGPTRAIGAAEQPLVQAKSRGR